MKEEIKIPAMGESVTEASIASIIKQSGSPVTEGEEIIEIETEKVNQMLYAPVSGEIEWKVKEGDTVAIGEVIGSIDTAKQKEEKPPPPPKEAKVGKREEVERPPPKEEVITPIKIGRESRVKMTKIRKVIAGRLVEALHKSATLTTFNEVDMSRVIELRDQNKERFIEKHGVKLGFMSFFVKAVTQALHAFPYFNAYIEGEEIVQREYYDIGIAVGTERGLVVPVLRNCEKLSFPEIERAIADFAHKAREGGLSLSDLEGGGFTITNGGVYGSLLSTPILNPPQVGILGMHQIKKRVVAIEDQIVIRPMMYLALSYDHRLIDGKDAILFLVRIKELLEKPEGLDLTLSL